MKKYKKKIVISIILLIVIGIVSGIGMYNKLDNTSQDILLKYVSSKKSEESGIDLIDVYNAIVEGYNSGDNVVGEDVSRLIGDTFKDYIDRTDAEMNYFTLNLTNRCNLDCSYCFEKNKDNHDITPKVLDEFINFVLKNKNYPKL